MKQILDKLKRRNGFTMIEVICVLVLLGMLTAIAIARMSSTSEYDLAAQVEVIKGHLRIAQARAMSSASPWGIQFTAKTYYLFQGTGSTTPVLLPGEDNATVSLTTKKSTQTIKSVTPNALASRVTFDAYGSPGTAEVTITTGDGRVITITKNTGFIP
ncbi:MAG TPA: prepilin-type N-terminal cleavage/methylation domain-containing protein [Smithellaceae bacterium]|nr:prepilin-type N-terminal cleavage/methylation domain-containing protein [Smithellaceae bacterium]